MSLPRAAKLLAAMPDGEQREFERLLRSAARRDSLHTLYDILVRVIRSGRPYDKEETFQKLYGRPYTEGEDYLIRNELRLLASRIYDFIAECEHRREFETHEGLRDVMLVKGLFERRLFPEFESAIDRCYRSALDRHDFPTAVRLKDLHYRYLIFHNEISPDVMIQAHSVTAEHLLNIRRVYRNDAAVNRSNRIVCEENLRLMSKPVGQTEIAADADFDGCDTPFALFYDYSSRAYRATGEERIAHAHAAVEHIRTIAEFFPGNMILGLAMLASSYFIENRYQEARPWFEECMAFAESHGEIPRVDIIFNHGSLLVRLGEYRNALELFEKYRDVLDSEPKVRYRCDYIRCFCHIFLGDPASAVAAVPPNITQRPESEYQSFRLVFLIVPYLNNDLESGLRECRNFADYFTRHKGDLLFPGDRVVVGLYRRFYAVMADATDSAMLREKLAPIAAELDELINGAYNSTDRLPLVWLRREIEELCR